MVHVVYNSGNGFFSVAIHVPGKCCQRFRFLEAVLRPTTVTEAMLICICKSKKIDGMLRGRLTRGVLKASICGICRDT